MMPLKRGRTAQCSARTLGLVAAGAQREKQELGLEEEIR
jgi:hypothetical protein